ncbi:MAG TPA: hypothetical protein VK611_28510 [Acidimicrobiales bacterium]|nr:hypothetical protein [Acidimicrobiales bacterium]
MTAHLVAIEWSQGIEDAWSDVATFVPKLIGFLAILIIGYFVARIVARIARRLLDRAGLDRVVEQGGMKQALSNSSYDAAGLVSKGIYYVLLLIVLQMAFGVFGDNAVSDMISSVIAYLPKVIVAVVIMVVAAAIANMARDMIGNSLGGLSYGKLLGTVAAAGIVVVGVFAALSQLEIAPAIINSLFYAILAVVAGSLIVALGGGGIGPMRQRWENVLTRYDEEKPRLQQHMQEARERRASETGIVEGQGEADMSRSQQRTRTESY